MSAALSCIDCPSQWTGNTTCQPQAPFALAPHCPYLVQFMDEKGYYRMRTRTKIVPSVVVVLGIIVAVGVGLWANRDSPEAVDINQALDTIDTANEDSDAKDAFVLDGTWTVGSTQESFAGVRIDEELRGVGAITAVLRTPEVTGEAIIADGILTDLSISVDLTTLTSDDARRDRSIAGALDLASFPLATFTLADTVDVSALANGEQVRFAAAGTLVINGVSQPATVDVTVDTSVSFIVAVAQIPVVFADFGVDLPSAPIVLSLSDEGIIETQLLFRR